MEGKKIIYLNQPYGPLRPINAKINIINPLPCEISDFQKQNFLHKTVFISIRNVNLE